MSRTVGSAVLMVGMFAAMLVGGASGQEAISLVEFAPEHYKYVQAERCANCHSDGGDILRRAVGIETSTGSPQLTGHGWLGSVHARSQSHGDRVNTACAWCHAPTTPGATRDSLAAEPIEFGTWEGVTCGACHPVGLADSLEESLVTNLHPGSDPSDPSSFVFIDRSDPQQLNSQCQFCHHEYHDFTVATKTAILDAGVLRCIDCHMAGYDVASSGLIERYHNMKVEANGPISCSGAYGTNAGCHVNATAEWMRASIPDIKSPRKEW